MRVRGDILAALVLGLFFLCLYGMTLPGNHSDAENAFHYAWQVDHAPLRDSAHHDHLFFIPVAQTIQRGLQVVGIEATGYAVLVGLSMLTGAISVAFGFLILRQRLQFSREVALFTAGLIGVSYGFWRYAGEAGPPVVAAAPLMVAIYILTSRKVNIPSVALGAAAAAGATLIHILAGIPAILAFPALLMGRRRRAPLLVYVVLVVAMIVAAYAAMGPPPYADPAEAYAGVGNVHLNMQGPAAIGNAAMGFGHTLISANFLFCLQTFQDCMTRIFAHRMLREELFMGQYTGQMGAILPFITLALLVIVGLFVADDRLGFRSEPPTPTADPSPPSPTSLRPMVLLAMLIWFAVHAVVVLSYEPANPEGWILAVPPLWIALILLYERRGRGVPPQALGTFFMLMLLHNYFGGMRLLSDSGSDYNQAKSTWILDHTRARDLILTADCPAGFQYLRYRAKADVIDVQVVDLPAVLAAMQATRHRGGNILATGDVFAPPDTKPHTSNPNPKELPPIADALRPAFVPVAKTPFGKVWLHR
ncbi:MAG: hypothetical protein HQ523_00470 [Lentisphaerae bacterium]|nr:hypothetical protein [Lentisphaerota bacterium]